MFINGDCYWIIILTKGIVTYYKSIYSAIKITPTDVSHNQNKVMYTFTLKTTKLNFNFFIM